MMKRRTTGRKSIKMVIRSRRRLYFRRRSIKRRRMKRSRRKRRSRRRCGKER